MKIPIFNNNKNVHTTFAVSAYTMKYGMETVQVTPLRRTLLPYPNALVAFGA